MNVRAGALLLSLIACDRPATAGAEWAAVDSAGVRITTIAVELERLPQWLLAEPPVLTLSGAESSDSTALSSIAAVRWLSDGGLVVADLAASRLLVYNASGTFRRALGRNGSGPGELRNIASVSVLANDTVATFDGELRRLSFWHADQGFIRSVGPFDAGTLEEWPADVWPWQDTLLVVLQMSTTPRPPSTTSAAVARWPMRAHLTLRDREGRILGTSPGFPGAYTGVYDKGDTRLPFANRPFVGVASDRVYYGSGEDYSLSYLTSQFIQGGEIRWPK